MSALSNNGATAVTDWYDPMQAAAVLGVSGPQLRQLRDTGGLPQDAWRNVTRHKRRSTEYNPAVIDRLAVTNTGESTVAEPTTDITEQYASEAARERRKADGAHVPIAEVWLAPREAEALAVVAKLGPFHDDSGRATSQVAEAMPTGGYQSNTVSGALRALEEYALIRREMNGKRTYDITVTSRGRKYVAANRAEMPHVPDTRHGLTPAAPDDRADMVERPLVDEPEAPPADAITVRNVDTNGQVHEHVLTAPEPEPAPAAPEPAPEPEPAPVPPEPEPATEAPVAAAEPAGGLEALPLPPPPVADLGAALGGEVTPGAIANALLRQAVRVLSDGDVATLMAERDALAAQVASLSGHVAQLRQRATDAEAEAREAKGVLHQVEAQLTPLLVGREARTEGWLDAATRTELLGLITEVAKWA